jgi:hypothetical protein
MRAAILFALLLTAACATPTKYQPMGFGGGVAAQQLTADTFRIEGRGNGFTASNTVKDYVLLKAAETTKQQGGSHFLIISGNDATRSVEIPSSGYAQTSFVGNTAVTTYSPASNTSVSKPGQDIYIRILKVQKGQPVPQGAMAADEIIQFVGSRIERN